MAKDEIFYNGDMTVERRRRYIVTFATFHGEPPEVADKILLEALSDLNVTLTVTRYDPIDDVLIHLKR